MGLSLKLLLVYCEIDSFAYSRKALYCETMNRANSNREQKGRRNNRGATNMSTANSHP